LLRKFAPKQKVRSIYAIDLEALRTAGIKGIITDLDNTLVKTREQLADEQVVAWFQFLKDEGFKVVIVSNNTRKRVGGFSMPINIPYIHGARKPTSSGFRKALAVLGLSPQETAVIGDQVLTDVLGGNMLGMYTILVEPCSLEGEKFVTRINRSIEKIVVKRMRKKGIFPREDS
jgi:HAD superfamily phosphatase (TIGR01668 family)